MKLQIFLLLALTSMSAMAADCDKLYQQAEQGHDALVAQEQGTKPFFDDLEKLESDMFKIMQDCATDARPVALMAEIQITARQAQLAQLYAQKALAINPELWQSQHAMGSVLTLVQQYDKALSHLQKASKLAPNRTGLQLSLCRTQALAGKHAKAIQTCTGIINSDEQTMHGVAYYLRSLAYNGLHETGRALKDQQKAKSLGFNP